MKIGEMYTDGKYLKHNPTWDVDDAAWKADLIFALIQKHELNPVSLCEVGCGSGEILKQLQQKMDEKCTFTGYEISPQAMELANQRSNERLIFRLRDICEESDVSYDLILLIDLIEHLEDYFEFLRILKGKSRYKILHIPLEMFVLAVLYPHFHQGQREKVGHLHYFSKDMALQILRDQGYEIIDFMYTKGYSLPHHQSCMKDKILGIPRTLLYPVIPDLTIRLFGGYSLLVLVK